MFSTFFPHFFHIFCAFVCPGKCATNVQKMCKLRARIFWLILAPKKCDGKCGKNVEKMWKKCATIMEIPVEVVDSGRDVHFGFRGDCSLAWELQEP